VLDALLDGIELLDVVVLKLADVVGLVVDEAGLVVDDEVITCGGGGKVTATPIFN